MTVVLGVERPFSGPTLAVGELQRTPAGVLAQTIPFGDVGTTPLTTVTATIHCSSIILPENLPVSNLGVIVTVTGTVTGFWQALIDSGLVVRAVSANVAATSAGFFTQSVLAAALPFVTRYPGLYYHVVGTVSTVAPQIAAQAAMPSVASVSGPPVYCGTSATAATTTPPAVGTQLGALTGVASNEFYGQVT